MTRWAQGQAAVGQMLDAGELDRVPTDGNATTFLMETAERHVASASQLERSDPDAA